MNFNAEFKPEENDDDDDDLTCSSATPELLSATATTYVEMTEREAAVAHLLLQMGAAQLAMDIQAMIACRTLVKGMIEEWGSDTVRELYEGVHDKIHLAANCPKFKRSLEKRKAEG